MAEKAIPINLSWSFNKIPARKDQTKKVRVVRMKYASSYRCVMTSQVLTVFELTSLFSE
jgi:hypothetical protein